MIKALGRRGMRMLLTATALLAGAAGVALATIPGSDGVINGCFEKRTGLLRVIDIEAGKKCTIYETPISWNQKGEKGLQGIQGEKGEKGDAGAQGEQGLPGPPGPAGADGKDGAAGPPGAEGKDGASGAPGADGKDGQDGISVTSEPLAPGEASCANGGSKFTAANGITYACNGAPGADGQDGATGPTGPQGPRGLEGPTGPQGAQGPAGPPISSLADLDGIQCEDPDTQWLGTVRVSIGPGAGAGGSGGVVTIKCVPVQPVTLALSWTGQGSFGVRYVGASSLFRQCFPGVQPGPTYTCSVSVIPGREVQIEAFAGVTSGRPTSWGGACAGIGTIGPPLPSYMGKCRLTMDAAKSVSVVFEP